MRTFSKAITPFMPLPSPDILRSSDACEIGNFLAKRELFASGRDAMFRIAKILGGKPALWIPRFFCPPLLKPLSEFFQIQFYDDYPSMPLPEFNTLNATEGDVVLAVNFFGLRGNHINIDSWRNWKSKNPKITLVGDFTHAPFCRAQECDAFDFVFASFRKSLPIPDGAFLYTARGNPSPMFSNMSPAGICDFAADFLQAAALCGTYGPISHTEDEYLYYRAETKLNSRRHFSPISAFSQKTLRRLDIKKIETARAENAMAFSNAVLSAGNPHVEELNRKFSNFENLEDCSIFAPILKFSKPSLRDSVYDALSKVGARPCIYWGGFGKGADKRTLKEESSLLAVPLDFRHSLDDALKAASIVISCF